MLVLSFVYVINALALYFETEIADTFGLAGSHFTWVCLSSIFSALLAVAGYRLLKLSPAPRDWPSLDWRKAIILVSIFSAMALSNGIVGIAQKELIGGEAIDGIPADEYAQHQRSFLGKKLDSGTAVVLANTKKLTKTAVAAASEEIIYRWFVLGALLTIMRRGYAIAFSSVLFGLMHIFLPLGLASDPSEILGLAFTSTISGVFYAVSYLRAGLLCSILFHFIANLIPEFRDTLVPQYIAYVSLAITCFGLPIVLLERRYRKVSVKKS